MSTGSVLQIQEAHEVLDIRGKDGLHCFAYKYLYNSIDIV